VSELKGGWKDVGRGGRAVYDRGSIRGDFRRFNASAFVWRRDGDGTSLDLIDSCQHDAIEQMGRCIPLFWLSRTLSVFADLQRSAVASSTLDFAIRVCRRTKESLRSRSRRVNEP
jgi:hypothetical protein